jgi:hypothetical protein
MLPPLEQQRMADEFEPGSKFEGGIIEHRLQPLGSNPSSVADFVQIRFKINIGFDEEDIVN